MSHLSFALQKDELYLNLVLEYVPETVYRVARHFTKAKLIIPIIYVKVGSQAAAAQIHKTRALGPYGFLHLSNLGWSVEAYVPCFQPCSL